MKIYELLGTKLIEGDVGLEIECEGAVPEAITSKIWKAVGDGSLRNGGVEYIYKKPLKVEEVEYSVKHLREIMHEAGARIDFSFRTSVHVHVNCQDLEYQHLLNYIYIYLLLENILVDYCGEERKCNRFCLRTEDADGAVDLLAPLFKSKGTRDVLLNIADDRLRYAAMNVQALSKFGSLEFRAMRGTMDVKTITVWAETLVHLREYAKTFQTTKEVYERLEDVGYRKFFEESIGKHYEELDNGDVEFSIAKGQSLSIEIPFMKIREKLVLTDENRNDQYFYDRTVYSLEFLFRHFGAPLPDAVEDILQPYVKANKAQGFIEHLDVVFGDLEVEEEEEEYEED